ncbi:TonB-dependent receptor plug domain-containing protein [Simiduia agarivorans]|uniref:TonB-dependent receptor n=1 Tax=Simiduia agarivorans (strain DSM 21679 / JCM 13881 / BCRC 17597 / SA1) TaxID=1117647 RepID=K4KRW9_SIMAS|nr:TonB-dependent receptor [Simiduia agarivorans]AFV00904.1 TonB-dependent receptor [Simiduia agarivorans SA1 = DSM 21679]
MTHVFSGIFPLALLATLTPTLALAQASNDLDSLSLEQLLNQRTSLHMDSLTGSAQPESVRDLPGAMVIVDADTIRQRGYDSLDDIVQDLPGFDNIVTNGTEQLVAYQRGYRTPWTQRTLLLVNGRVDNNLWNHTAHLSRQYPITLIERVEVLYGPSGAVYGPNAFLGVINIITRQGAAVEDGTTKLNVEVSRGSYQTQALDLTLLGRQGDLSFSLGGRAFTSDEAPIEDYSDWGFTNPALLRDPDIWGAGIGAGTDSITGRPSPAGDINVDGQVTSDERVRGQPLGEYRDPSENYSVFGELHHGNLSVGANHWKTDEGYGPYYSFADGQPNAHWISESTQGFARYLHPFNAQTALRTDLTYRESRVGGDWAESFAGAVSLTEWNSFSTGWRFEQLLSHQWSEQLNLTGGIKYERKRLSKIYMICNYFDGLGVCPAQGPDSIDGISSDGSGVRQADAINSDNYTPLSPSVPKRGLPEYNRIDTTDTGAFIQAIYDWQDLRFNLGLRWDRNSEYGTDVNPRLATIYHWRPDTSFKLVYGEAFQEPSPKDLYGDFSGRAANMSLRPEKARNLEFIAIHQSELFLHDMSLFRAQYKDAIAGAQNVGGRDVYGFEYRGSATVQNPLAGLPAITGNLYYTFTRATADQQYNNATGEWDSRRAEQGDIAPHKITAIINLPIAENTSVNLRGNWIAARNLFSENPLRADQNPLREQNRQAPSYFKLDAHLLYDAGNFRLGLKIENLTGSDYLHPGVEGAATGDDFAVDTDGFQNSLIPQVKKPVLTFYLGAEL